MRLFTRPRPAKAGGVGTILLLLWEGYSHLQTAEGLPSDIRRLLHVFEQSPPWIAFIPFVALLIWGLLPERKRISAKEANPTAVSSPADVTSPEVTVEPRIFAEFSGIQVASDSVVPDLWLISFLIGVRNGRQDKRTLRRVTAKLHGPFGSPQSLPCYPGSTLESDLRHGEMLYFELAKTVSDQLIGVPSFRLATLTEAQLVEARTNMKDGPFVEVGRKDDIGLRMVVPRNLPRDTNVVYPVVVSADDVKASALNVRLDGSKFPDLFEALEVVET